MLENDLKLRVIGLDTKVSNKLYNAIVKAINRFQDLDLRRFEQIIITPNVQEKVDDLLHHKTFKLINRYKNQGDVFAKVITVPKGQTLEIVLILDNHYAQNLLKLYEKRTLTYQDTLHIFHHELAHVHDYNQKIDHFEAHLKHNSYKGLQSLLYPIAEVCWSEYFANFVSSSSLEDSLFPKMLSDSLMTLLESTKQEIRTYVNVFESNPDRIDILNDIQQSVIHLFKTSAYLMGYIHGTGKSLQQINAEADYAIEVSYFKEFWHRLSFELSSISEIYPQGWQRLRVYENLAHVIDDFYDSLGVHLAENENKEVYFRVK